ncbi:MAG: hypothetical protein JWN96_2371 [Mycobacterium sp.]|nr:hypothetical protein [Mycobacterium sp.]
MALRIPSRDVETVSMARTKRAERHRRRPSLVLRFALVSGILTGLFGAVLGLWFSATIRHNNIAYARDSASYSRDLALSTASQAAALTTSFNAAQFDATRTFLKAMVSTGKYVGATAWLTPSTVAVANEPGRIGKHETARPELALALRGQLVSIIVRTPIADIPDATERAGLVTAGPLLETFVPVFLDGKVVAAVQLYQPWRPVEKQIDHETTQMLLIVSAGAVVVWLGLMGFIISAARQLRVRDTTNWRLASHDTLTGLPNRKLIRERVEQALSAASRSQGSVGMLLIDLDGFKEVNDTLGHHSGDLLLEQIGPRLADTLREADSVARLGGDEFVVLLPDLSGPAEAMATAQRVSASFAAAPFAVEGLDLDVKVSIGIATSPDHGADFDALLRHADVGMYAAKHSGTGVAAYSPRAERDLATVRLARRTLARRSRPRASTTAQVQRQTSGTVADK